MPTPEFTYTPNYTYPVTDEWDTGVTQSRNGAERRASRRNSVMKSWELDFRTLTESDATGMQIFFNARKGRFEAFNWTCLLDSTQYLVRFDTDKLTFEKTGNKRFRVRVPLRQVTA